MNLIAMGIHKLRAFLLARQQPLLAVANANASSATTEDTSPFNLEKK
jgi:hypothetical protein